MSVVAVYDTMLFFQAASQPQRTYGTFAAARDGRVKLCVSAELLAEVRDVLTRPRYTAKFPALTHDAVDAFLVDVLSFSTLVRDVPTAFSLPRHPDDDHVFNLAITSGAECLVTWEKRILAILDRGEKSGLELRGLAPQLAILTPEELMRRLPRSRSG